MSATETETERVVREEQEAHDEGLRSVPDPDPDPEPEPPEQPAAPTPPMQIALPGDWEAISDTFGGADPEVSEIRLLGGKMPIEGSFPKGTELDLLVRVKVTGVLGQDVTDDWGKVERTVRRHFARMISVRRANR